MFNVRPWRRTWTANIWRIIERNNRLSEGFLSGWDCFLFFIPHIGLQAKHWPEISSAVRMKNWSFTFLQTTYTFICVISHSHYIYMRYDITGVRRGTGWWWTYSCETTGSSEGEFPAHIINPNFSSPSPSGFCASTKPFKLLQFHDSYAKPSADEGHVIKWTSWWDCFLISIKYLHHPELEYILSFLLEVLKHPF